MGFLERLFGCTLWRFIKTFSYIAGDRSSGRTDSFYSELAVVMLA